MKRKTSTLPTRIYSFGCLPPTSGSNLIDDQIRLAHKYKNTLIEIERWRRAFRAAVVDEDQEVSAFADMVARLEVRLTEVRSEISATRTKTRTRVVDDDILDDAALVRRAIKVANKDLKMARSRVRARHEVKECLDDINAQAWECIREARSRCGVYWGTYLQCEAAVDAACIKPTMPRFHRFDGDGRVAVQLQGGLSVSDAFGDDKRFQLDRVPDDAWSVTRGEQRKKTRSRVRIRIGSQGRSPIWAELPVLLHRPLPEVGRIMWAWILRRRRGPTHVMTKNFREVPNYEWRLQMAIEAAAHRPPGPAVRPKSVVAMEFGWRTYDQGIKRQSIRVAYWVDDQGEHGELTVPCRLVDRLEYADRLRSIRDKLFEDERLLLHHWILTHANECPGWLIEAKKTLLAWKSHDRFVSLLRYWSAHRFLGDTDGYDQAMAWRRKDEHLWTWEDCQRTKALRWRRDLYRVIAAKLTDRYETIVVEALDLNKFAELPLTEDGTASAGTRLRHMRAVVAPSKLRIELESAASARGRNYVKLEIDRTTQRCQVCGCEEPWDAASSINHTCIGCGKTWDQDKNHSHNILANYLSSGPMASGDAKVLVPSNRASTGSDSDRPIAGSGK